MSLTLRTFLEWDALLCTPHFVYVGLEVSFWLSIFPTALQVSAPFSGYPQKKIRAQKNQCFSVHRLTVLGDVPDCLLRHVLQCGLAGELVIFELVFFLCGR